MNGAVGLVVKGIREQAMLALNATKQLAPILQDRRIRACELRDHAIMNHRVLHQLISRFAPLFGFEAIGRNSPQRVQILLGFGKLLAQELHIPPGFFHLGERIADLFHFCF